MAISNLLTPVPYKGVMAPPKKDYSSVMTPPKKPVFATSTNTGMPTLGSTTNLPNAPIAKSAVQAPAALPKAEVQPFATQPVSQGNPPAYNAQTGLLTDYGRSSGLPEVNAPQRPVSSPTVAPSATPQASTRGLFPNIVSSLAGRANQPSPLTTQAMEGYQKAVENQQKLRSNIAGKIGDIESDNIPLEFQQGRAQAMSRQFSAQELAAQQAVTQQQQGLQYGIQQQGLEQQALQQAASLSQPQLNQYGQTYYNPLDPAGGGGDFSGSLDTYAKGMANNSISPSQVPSSIANNPVLFAQLIQRAQQMNPSFNPTQWQANTAAQSTALQQNVTTGLTMQRSADAAYQALDSLQSTYSSLGPNAQGSLLGLTPNIPLISQAAQGLGMATGLGREQISAFQGSLKEARAQINTVLAPLVGVDSANATSQSLLPDNMVPSEIPQKIAAAKEYIRQRVQAFTTTGGVPQYGQQQNNTYAPTTSNSQYDW